MSLLIGQVAERAGIRASALRYYETEGLLPKAARLNGRRVYEESILGRLKLIEAAKSAGFTVAEIRQLVRGFGRSVPPGKRWRDLADAKRAELQERIAEAERMKQVLDALTRCACPTFEDCADALRDESIPRRLTPGRKRG